MPKPSSAEVVTQKHIRFWTQPGGPHPANPVFYSGVSNAYMNIESVTNPARGGINPINVHSPQHIGQYRKVGRQIDAPDFPTFTVQYLQPIGILPKHLVDARDCESNYYQLSGQCEDHSEFLRGWNDYVKIYSKALVIDPTEAGGSFDSDEMLQDENPNSADSVYNIGKISFGEKATIEVYSELKDVVYGSKVQCGECGPPDNGTNRIYAVAENTVASPGQAPSVFYTLDKGVTPVELAITGAASTDIPVAIAIVGPYLIVVFTDATAGGYFYTELNSITGAPGAAWTKVTTGFVANKDPLDVYVANAGEIWFCGNEGYIYKSTNITAGVSVVDAGVVTVQNLNRVHGFDETIVCVGEAGATAISLDRGVTWNAAAAAPSANGLDAIDIVGDFLWWTGDDTGGLFYTTDQGASWTTSTLLPATATAIQDIVSVTPEVIHILTTASGPTATMFTTWNGLQSITSGSPRLLNWPVFDRANRIAFPDVPNRSVAANNISIAGLAGNGADGIWLIAAAAMR